jgi:hypothetical protein
LLDSFECQALVAETRRDDHDGRSAKKFSTPHEEQMGSTPFGDADPAPTAGLAAPQDIEVDRGSDGRVRVDGRA